MRKIDLTPFNVKAMRDEEFVEAPYMLRDSMAGALFVPGLNLGALGLLRNNKIAEKILFCESNTLLLEEDEYSALRAGFETATGFRQTDVEMVRRVMEAPVVEVIEKPVEDTPS